jgi:hypothetical protein
MPKSIAIMKKQISITLLILFILTACEKELLREEELLQKRDAVESVTPNLLLSSIIQKSAFLYQYAGGAGNKTLATTVQYMQGNRSSEDNTFKSYERPKSDLYSITWEIKLVQAAIDDVHKKGLKTHEGIFMIFKSLLWSVATDLYGDIYYTEGLRGQEGFLFPKFDEQKDIYPALIQNLVDATQLLSEGTDPIDKTYDILYKGDKTKWTKLANSLRLRLLMRASNKLPDAASKIAAVAALPLMSDISDNASIDYLPGDKTYSWPMGSSYMGYTDDFLLMRPSKTLVDSLKSLNDERLKIWVAPIERPWTDKNDSILINTYTDPNTGTKFGKRTITQKGYTYDFLWEYIDRSNPVINTATKFILDSLTIYAGYQAGMYEDVLSANGSYEFPDTKWNYKVSIFSKLFNENSNPLLKACIMQSDEVQFLLAEASVKGYISGTNDAEDYYKSGVELALQRWGEPLPANYFDNPKAKFPASGTTDQKLAKIGLQKWLGLFMMGTEAYADYRRTRLPFIELNGNLSSGLYKFPLRFRYPETELNNNAENYQIAIGRLDKGDTEFSKMWLLQ